MLTLGPVAFLSPWFLLGLLALPIIWLLLRATPPRPKVERFPGVRVLLGLDDKERTPQRTPWWLLLLRLTVAALVIGAFAEPTLNPKGRLGGDDPVLIVMDGGWASAPDWEVRKQEARSLLDKAGASDRPAALIVLTDTGAAPENLRFGTAGEAVTRLEALEPVAARPDPARFVAAVQADSDPIDVYWLHSGLATGDKESAAAISSLAEALKARGALTLIGPKAPALALSPPEPGAEGLQLTALRVVSGSAAPVGFSAYGQPPSSEDASGPLLAAGGTRRLATADAAFEASATEAKVLMSLPSALANAVDRVEIRGVEHAGAVALLDDRSRRREVALVTGEQARGDERLLAGSHYVAAALEPSATVRRTSLAQALGLKDAAALSASGIEGAAAAPRAIADVIVLVDVGRMDAEVEAALTAWVEKGGLLIRFAGPRLAALAAERSGFGGRMTDPLLPVALRGGGRALGGALSWAEPQKLRTFEDRSPFVGIKLSDEVTVARQVLADPEPGLSQRVWATLADGTPLVTSKPLGAGRIILFHTTAAPGWSTLPLSGVFVEMMERMVASAPALSRGVAQLEEDGRLWRPTQLIDGFGARREQSDAATTPIEGAVLSDALKHGASVAAPAGYYVADGEDGAALTLAVSAVGSETAVAPRPAAPSGASERVLDQSGETAFKPPLLAIGLMLLLLDALAALFLAGRLRKSRPSAAALAVVAGLGAAVAVGGPAQAQRADSAGPSVTAEDAQNKGEGVVDPAAQRAALDSVLAYIKTGDAVVDRTSAAGLSGLSRTLYDRTAVEPGDPAGVDLETDDLAVYSVLYWPITPTQRELSAGAVRKLNDYIRSGGMLVVDTRDAHRRLSTGAGPNARHLRRLIGRLDLPALEPMPEDHVLTRSFYLTQSAPGRWGSSTVWVASGGGGQLAESRARGEPTPLVNDGVSPIVLGASDWAAAWAADARGAPMFPMARDVSRENALRFGVNLVMYAYTGNYKTDQVHIKDVLERVGGGRKVR